ncbi:sigma-70 family RNA polymerase sigma factor [Paludisphaera borealis]|uniref:RNA polymerase sigma-70 region 4 domain-containing protein n=1 Tax=Paludisphaera borealis TaxID=1387353 RepID=A0A1U7CS72_9BACT|nr:sigma-70 family RNA polymerase sigma factor [Paludisphaera borealis]APW61723.1 hypothetical protein BSF38_03250 [Paludisphaera borealis]
MSVRERGGAPRDAAGTPARSDTWRRLEAERSFLRRAALRGLPGKADASVGASDVVHDALLEAKRWASSFRGRTRAEWRAWLLMVLRTRISRTNRKAGRGTVPIDDHPGMTPIDSAVSPSAAALGRESAAALRDALRWLNPKDRELLQLRHEDRLDFESIARWMGLPSSESARKRHMRAVNRLRLILGPADEAG